MSDQRALFPHQRPHEHVLLLLRRHWLILARDMVQFLALFVVPPIVFGALLIYTDVSFVSGTLAYLLGVLGTSIYLLFVSLLFFRDFVDYHLDVWIVTDQRIISMEQEGLFHRVVSELSIDSVQDVTSEVRGYLHTFFDYGEVYVQTAGERQRFTFEEVPHPSEVAKVVLQIHHHSRRTDEIRKVRDAEMMRQQFATGQKPHEHP